VLQLVLGLEELFYGAMAGTGAGAFTGSVATDLALGPYKQNKPKGPSTENPQLQKKLEDMGFTFQPNSNYNPEYAGNLGYYEKPFTIVPPKSDNWKQKADVLARDFMKHRLFDKGNSALFD
jgi:hypothetical protein